MHDRVGHWERSAHRFLLCGFHSVDVLCHTFCLGPKCLHGGWDVHCINDIYPCAVVLEAFEELLCGHVRLERVGCAGTGGEGFFWGCSIGVGVPTLSGGAGICGGELGLIWGTGVMTGIGTSWGNLSVISGAETGVEVFTWTVGDKCGVTGIAWAR